MRIFRRPQQGCTSTFNPDVEERIFESACLRMERQALAAGADVEISDLQIALWKRNTKEIKRLIPILKARYGRFLYALATGKALPPLP